MQARTTRLGIWIGAVALVASAVIGAATAIFVQRRSADTVLRDLSAATSDLKDSIHELNKRHQEERLKLAELEARLVRVERDHTQLAAGHQVHVSIDSPPQGMPSQHHPALLANVAPQPTGTALVGTLSVAAMEWEPGVRMRRACDLTSVKIVEDVRGYRGSDAEGLPTACVRSLAANGRSDGRIEREVSESLTWRLRSETVTLERGIPHLSAWEITCTCVLIDVIEPAEQDDYWEGNDLQLVDSA